MPPASIVWVMVSAAESRINAMVDGMSGTWGCLALGLDETEHGETACLSPAG